MCDSGNCSTSDEFTVLLEGGRPWGFTLQGGADFRSPLKIGKVTNGGRAQKAGLVYADIIASINGIPTGQMKHHEAQILITSSKTTLELVCTKGVQGILISPRSVTQEHSFDFPESNHSGSGKSNTLGHNRQRSLDLNFRPRTTSDAGKRAIVGAKIAGITVPSPPKNVRKLSEPNKKEEAKTVLIAGIKVPKPPQKNTPPITSDKKMSESPSKNDNDVVINDTPVNESIGEPLYIKEDNVVTYDVELEVSNNELSNEPVPDDESFETELKIFQKNSEDISNDKDDIIDIQSNGTESPESIKTGKNDDWYKIMFQSMKKGVDEDLPNKKPVWDRSPVPARKSVYEFESKASPNYKYKTISYSGSAGRRLSESSLPSSTAFYRPIKPSSSGSCIGQKKADVVCESSAGVVYQKNIRKYNQSRNYWKTIEKQASQERVEIAAKRNSIRRTSSASSTGIVYSPKSPDSLNSPSEEKNQDQPSTESVFFKEEVVGVLSAGVHQSIITEEDTKQSVVSPVSLGDEESGETMSKLHPLLKGDLEETQSDSKPIDEVPTDNVFSRIDASKLNTAIGNASVLQTMSHEGADPLTLQVAALSIGKGQSHEVEKSPAKKKKSKTTKPPPGKKAKAIFDFDATNDKELSLKKGNIINLTEQIDNNWLKGEYQGNSGMFPITYVKVLTPEEISLIELGDDPTEEPLLNKLAKAKHDFSATTDSALALAKGDIVTVLKSKDENWYEVMFGDRNGIVPKSYVEIVELEDTLQ